MLQKGIFMYIEYLDKSLYTIKEYNKGDIIFNQGDICTCLGICLSGQISIKSFSYNDQDFEITLISKNDTFGSSLVFKSLPYLGTGVCLKSSKVLFITKNNLLTAFKNQDFLISYLINVGEKHLNCQAKLKVLSQGSIRNKIFYLLFQNKSLTYSYKSIEDLARYLCVTRPSLSREIINMKKEGLIYVKNHKITFIKYK